jgi:enamine deaminase RidA (YjgF/YER057c/UK114 family)
MGARPPSCETSRVEKRLIAGHSPFEPLFGFSRAVVAEGRVHVSGTAPIPPDGARPPDGAYEQARLCLELIAEALGRSGSGLEHVVRTRRYLTDADDWNEVARAHGEVFADVRPAATLVVVAGLIDPAFKVEIEAEALVA